MVPMKMDGPVETKFSKGAPRGGTGCEHVTGLESQFPTRWSPGRFWIASVSPPRLELVFSKLPTLVFL